MKVNKTTGNAEATEHVMPYQSSREKGSQVEEMFDGIAPAYDLMNTAMTFGLHRNWRKRALNVALDQLSKNVGDITTAEILDVATGTGDLVFSLHRSLPRARITGIDLSEGMLKEARRKLSGLGENIGKLISFGKGDCLSLPFADESFDLVTVSYGVRNFEHIDRGLAEMTRVLKTGGILCIIELSVPTLPVIKGLYNIYSRRLIPCLGRLVSGDSRAYSYLPESIAVCPQRDGMTRLMKSSGLKECRWKSLTFGVVCYYLGIK